MGCCKSKKGDLPQEATKNESKAGKSSSSTAKPDEKNYKPMDDEESETQMEEASSSSDEEADSGIFLDHYKLGKLLGEGSGGVVYDAIHNTTNGIRAVKMCDRKSDRLHELDHEIEILTGIKNRYIVSFYEVFVDDNFTYVIMDKFTGGDLVDAAMRLHDNFEGRVRERWIINVVKQMFCAMEYLHDVKEIVHRDVKSDNFLVDRPDISDMKVHCVLADFGQCVYLKRNTYLQTTAGTKLYWSPEMIGFNGHDGPNYGHKTDVWSCGIVLYGLMSANFPFDDETEIINEELIMPISSFEAQDFIAQTLQKDERKRFSSADCNKHAWLMRDLGLGSAKKGVSTALDINDFCGPAENSDDESDSDASKNRNSKNANAGDKDGGPSLFLDDPNLEVKSDSTVDDDDIQLTGSMAFGAAPTVLVRNSGPSAADSDKKRIAREEVCVATKQRRGSLVKEVQDAHEDGAPTRAESVKPIMPLDRGQSRISQDEKGAAKDDKPKRQILIKTGSFHPTPFTLIEPDGKLSRYEWWDLQEQQNHVKKTQSVDSEFGHHDSARGCTMKFGSQSPEVIKQLLEYYKVDVSAFGKGTASTFENFAKECFRGEFSLQLDADGKLTRVLDAVLLHVHPSKESTKDSKKMKAYILVEKNQVLTDGRLRDVNRLPGAKRQQEENARDTAFRVLRDQLNLGEEDVDVGFVRDINEESTETSSYPGLRTRIRKHFIDCWVKTTDQHVLDSVGLPDMHEFTTFVLLDKVKQSTWTWVSKMMKGLPGVNRDTDTDTKKRATKKKLSVLNPAVIEYTPDALKTKLEQYGVTVAEVLKAERKTMEQFTQQVNNGEISLIPQGDSICRMIIAVVVQLQEPKSEKTLVHVSQQANPPNGKITQLNRLPFLRQLPHENVFLTARRVVQEVLKFKEEEVYFGATRFSTKEEVSSASGLKTVLRQTVVEASVGEALELQWDGVDQKGEGKFLGSPSVKKKAAESMKLRKKSKAAEADTDSAAHADPTSTADVCMFKALHTTGVAKKKSGAGRASQSMSMAKGKAKARAKGRQSQSMPRASRVVTE